MKARLDHLNMSVKNMKETVEFYTKYFDFSFKKNTQGSSSEGVILGKDDMYLCLYEYPPKKVVDEGLRINHFGMNVEKFDEFYQTMKKDGVFIEPYGVISHGKSRSFYIQDPSGHEIEISEVFGGGVD